VKFLTTWTSIQDVHVRSIYGGIRLFTHRWLCFGGTNFLWSIGRLATGLSFTISEPGGGSCSIPLCHAPMRGH
jgi:hypothetical protein